MLNSFLKAKILCLFIFRTSQRKHIYLETTSVGNCSCLLLEVRKSLRLFCKCMCRNVAWCLEDICLYGRQCIRRQCTRIFSNGCCRGVGFWSGTEASGLYFLLRKVWGGVCNRLLWISISLRSGMWPRRIWSYRSPVGLWSSQSCTIYGERIGSWNLPLLSTCKVWFSLGI